MVDEEMIDLPLANNENLHHNTMESDEHKGEPGGKETPAAGESKNLLTGEFTWNVEGFSSLPERVNSEPFEIGGYLWNLLLFPRGNHTAQNSGLSLYLAVADSDDGELTQRSASFALSVISQKNAQLTVRKEARHTFTTEQNDWGFTTFMNLADLLNPDKGFIVNNTVVIKVEVNVTMLDEDMIYDSRAETGFVGLKNQGATCYMNSLLQTLYNVNQFRKAVYRLPTSEDEVPAESMALALQSVFHMLQFTQGPVSTRDLTSSFGWNTMDAFQQHDVQELNRILCDRLEEKMKGTRVEGTINRLFEGHLFNYIECINIDYKSVRREAFQDLQLVVKGCKTIYDSFQEYCQVEILEGDNKYEAEGHGKQDARRGVLFESLPPVLNLHLRRFEYDFERDLLVKINDRHEFYSELDLDEKDENGNPSFLSNSADKTVRNKYKLLAVLVHSGGVHGGHYYAFIRPDGETWLKFDDERVEKATEAQAVQENWGGYPDSVRNMTAGYPTQPLRASRFANAYMLVYVRESEWDSIMCDVTEADISEHIRARLRAEEQEKERRRKERAEAHLYTMVYIATDEDLKRQIGGSKYFDIVDFSSVEMFHKVSKKAKFSEIQDLVFEKTGVKPANQRFWKFVQRQNHTCRPHSYLDLSENKTMAELQDKKATRQGEMSKMFLYLEALPEDPSQQVQPGELTMSVFFKQYSCDDGDKAPSLQYAGHAIVPRTVQMGELYPILKRMGDLNEDAEIQMFEEVKSDPAMIELIDPKKTAIESELDNGDIIIFQQAAKKECKFATAADFLKDIRNRTSVVFKPLLPATEKEEKDGTFMLGLLKDMAYDDISKIVAEHLGLDHPLKVRFTGQSLYTLSARAQPFKYSPSSRLEDMLKGPQINVNNPYPTMFYEVIDLPLPEFERLVTHKVAIHDSKHDEIGAVTVTVPRDVSVAQLLEEVRKQSQGKLPQDAPLRILEVYHWKIWQIFDPSLPVEDHMNANLWHLRAEVIPESQRDLDAEGRMHVHCLQVQERESNPNQAFAFSDPFIMDISKTETVEQLKSRVQKDMEIADEEFATWKVVLLSGLNLAMEPLEDDVVIADRLNPMDMSHERLYGHYDRASIGFFHENKNPRRTHAHINRASNITGQDRALRIKA